MSLNITSEFAFEMNSIPFVSVNAPVIVVGIIVNMYFVFCVTCPEQGSEQLKQPLKILLGSLFGFNTALHVCSLLWAVWDFLFFTYSLSSSIFSNVMLNLLLFSVRASVTSSLWLNVFYYCQIVPAQRSVFIWLKNNIQIFIYFALFLDKVYILLGLIINVADHSVFFSTYFKYTEMGNFTNIDQMDISATSRALSELVLINFWLRLVVNLINLLAMSAASCATILYLWNHIKNTKDSNSTFTSPHLRKQMRVTITGISQAVLYFFCSTWSAIDAVLRVSLPIMFDMDRHILCTVISFYSFATTINVCVGQSMLRKRVVHLWKRILHLFSHFKQ